MVTLSDFIHIYDNNLSPEICNYLIELFENNCTSNMYNFTENKEVSKESSSIHNQILKNTLDIRNEYYTHYYGRIFPDVNAFEKFTITKVFPAASSPDAEVDVKSYESARRFLCFKWYLNYNSGGQTKFLDLTISSGDLLIVAEILGRLEEL